MKALLPINLKFVLVCVLSCVEVHAVTYEDAVLGDAPVVYYRFEEAAGTNAANAGSLGATHDATHINGVKAGQQGALGGAASNFAIGLDGSNDFSTINSTIANADFGAGSYTVELWFNKANSGADDDLISITNTSGAGHGVLLEAKTGQKLRYLHRSPAGNSGGQNINPSNQGYTVGQWHHLVAVNDANSMKLYLDGNLDSVTNTASGPLGFDVATAIGRLSTTLSDRHFPGLIDELALYNRALSDAEVQEHFDAAAATQEVIRTPVLNVDFGATGHPIQPGFEAFTRATPLGVGTHMETYGGIGVTVATSAGNVDFRDRADVNHPLGDLAESFVFSDVDMTLALADLAGGDYELRVFFHDRDFAQSNIDIMLTDANGVDLLVAEDLLASFGATPGVISSGLVGFTSNGTDDIVLTFLESGTQPRGTTVITFAGFELSRVEAVPEPATATIAMLGLGGLMMRRRRCRTA